MAGLFIRIFPTDTSVRNIAVHTFRAMVGDYVAGHTTRADIITHWNLDAEAQTDLNALCDTIDTKTPSEKTDFQLELHNVLIIGEAGVKYTTEAEFKTRLGL